MAKKLAKKSSAKKASARKSTSAKRTAKSSPSAQARGTALTRKAVKKTARPAARKAVAKKTAAKKTAVKKNAATAQRGRAVVKAAAKRSPVKAATSSLKVVAKNAAPIRGPASPAKSTSGARAKSGAKSISKSDLVQHPAGRPRLPDAHASAEKKTAPKPMVASAPKEPVVGRSIAKPATATTNHPVTASASTLATPRPVTVPGAWPFPIFGR
ncbi:MAG: hypothetical protein H7125_01640 [Proteobacteria bacterium]|nr:hypothetical protein [Burkholderiales bacterium]